jgi:phospholipid/cholesterol/gamma-HCH transport system permease protein
MSDLLTLQSGADGLQARLTGQWRIDNVTAMEAALAGLATSGGARVELDYSGLEGIDMSGAWLLRERLAQLREQGVQVDSPAGSPGPFAFLEEISQRRDEEVAAPAERRWRPRDLPHGLGREVIERVAGGRDALVFFGRTVVTLRTACASLRHLRLPAIVRHVYEAGIQAVPIVSLIAFLIAVIVAYLGSQQLVTFGAEIFTVDLVAIAVLREMGVLLTAILVAGRSGSAYAAEIGVMELNDEIDALAAMGIDPYEVLVLPRVIGLIIALPLLTIVADAMGLVGGALLSMLLLDISLEQFIVRLQDALSPTTFWAGLVKAPVFALLIALVGTLRGLQVRDSSRELGRLTTVAVVQSIFLVILADALFAVLFVELDF